MASITTRSSEIAAAAQPRHRPSPGIPARHLLILCAVLASLWILCNASVWAISTLAAGTWPAASLALGWPLGLCVTLTVWLGGGGFWRLVIANGWCIVFPIATPHYFDLAAKLGLFLGRVPDLQASTLTHAAVFFLLPTAVTVATIAWAAHWQRTNWVLILTLLTTAGTALQVCWCGQNLIDNPLLQLWVWNGIMISGLCISSGVRLLELMREPKE